MTYPTKYSRQFDFASYQNANPTRPLPGNQVNIDLNAVKQSVTEIVDFLKTSIRSDGQLMNGSVGRNQLADNIFLGFDPPTDWQPLTIYTTSSTVFHGNIFYKANVDHTSGESFDGTKWDVIADFSAAVTAAAASADAAATSANAAATSAASIVGDASAAAASADAAAVSEANAAASAAASETNAAGVVESHAPYDDIAAAEAATVPADRAWIKTLGMDVRGIETGATWKEVVSAPSHGAYLTDAGRAAF